MTTACASSARRLSSDCDGMRMEGLEPSVGMSPPASEAGASPLRHTRKVWADARRARPDDLPLTIGATRETAHAGRTARTPRRARRGTRGTLERNGIWACRIALASTSAPCSTCRASTKGRSCTSKSRTRRSASSHVARTATQTARAVHRTSSRRWRSRSRTATTRSGSSSTWTRGRGERTRSTSSTRWRSPKIFRPIRTRPRARLRELPMNIRAACVHAPSHRASRPPRRG